MQKYTDKKIGVLKFAFVELFIFGCITKNEELNRINQNTRFYESEYNCQGGKNARLCPTATERSD